MNITLKYYGLLGDLAQKNEELITLEKTITLSSLRTLIDLKYPAFTDFAILYAINNQRCNDSELIPANCIVDCLPPFAGG